MNQTPGIVRDLAQILISAGVQKEINLSPDRKQSIDALLRELSIRALTALREHRLTCFDALVGDTSCQLRAIKILSVHAEMQKSLLMQEHLQRLLNSLGNPNAMESEKLSDDDKFVILSYLLHMTRDRLLPRKTNAANMGELADIRCLMGINVAETSLLDKIVFQAKMELSKRSVKVLTIEADALSLQGAEKKALVAIAKKCSIIGGAGVSTTPCFFNLQILLENIRTRGIPIVLVIHRVALKTQFKLAFRSLDQKTFEQVPFLELKESEEAMVFQGISTYEGPVEEYLAALLNSEDSLERYPHSRLLEILLTNAAKHPQYVKKEKGKHVKVSIPLFEKDVPGIFKPNPNPWESGLPKSVEDVYDEVYLLAKKEKSRDYEKLILKVGGIASKKLMNGLKAAVNGDPVVMCAAYILQKELEDQAETAGLCNENPHLFSIKHIYADIVGNHLPGIGKEKAVMVSAEEVSDDEE